MSEVVDLEEGLQSYSSESTFDQLYSMLWRPPSPPITEGMDEDDAGDPELPDNLDMMWLDDLRKVQKEFGRYLGYVSDQKALYAVAITKLKAQVDFVEDFLYTRVYIKGTQKSREAGVRTDRAFVEVNNTYLDAKALLAAINTRMEKLARALDIVSRQITIVMGNPENSSIGFGYHEENK